MDEIIISVKAGNGGRGCESYFRRKDHKTVPDGGDGGSGGDIIIRSDIRTGSLVPLKSKRLFEAESGTLGGSNNRYGQKGNDLILKVPCGTTVFDETHGLLLRDLKEEGDEVIAVKGGRGGYGNHGGRQATRGEEGKSLDLRFVLSIISDIVLIGLPNSGKTTLLKALTGAHVEPAEYPFATKQPCLGTYEGEIRELRVCDLPALYGRSEEGKGLGNAFLRHVKRVKLIFMVLDPINSFAKDLQEGYHILLKELGQYDQSYLNIPRLVLINKMDLAEAQKRYSEQSLKAEEPQFEISALKKTGLETLMAHVTQQLTERLA